MLKIIFMMLLLTIGANAQQPFTPFRSLNMGNMFDCGAGPVCVDLNNNTSGTISPAIVGLHLASFSILVSPSPPVFPQQTPFGLLDLDFASSFVWQSGILGMFSAPHPLTGTNIAIFPLNIANWPSGLGITMQCLMSDPGAPNGFLLTNAIFVFK